MTTAPRTLSEAAASCGARLRGADDASNVGVAGVAGLTEASERHVTFYTNAAYRAKLVDCRAAAIIVSEDDASLPELSKHTLLIADSPYAAFARLAQAFHPRLAPVAGIDARAHVDPEAQVDASARIEAFAWVGRGARIGARVLVEAGAHVGNDATIGDDTCLYANAVVRAGCIIGARCILQPGAVVGADGFGFAFDSEGDGEGPIHRKIPHLGIVRIEDDVELGANACVDRATLGETVIGRGVKIDNLVQLAHNVRVGPLTVMAAQVGVAGSTTIGAGVQLGGQAGVNGHIDIGDMARIGAQSGVVQPVEPGAVLHGFPAMEAKGWLRSSVVFARLPQVVRELRELAKRVASLESARDR